MPARYEQFVEDRNITPFVISRLNYVMEEKLKNHFPSPLSCITEFTNGDMKWYVDTVQWKKYGQQIAQEVCTNPTKYYNFNKTLRNNIEELKKFSNALYAKNLANTSSEEVYKIYLEGTYKYERVYEFGIIPSIADLGEPYLSTKLKENLKHHDSSQIAQNFITLTTPHEPSALMQEEIALMELAIDQTQDAGSPKVKAHQAEFYWLTFGYEGPLYSTEEIWRRIIELRKNPKLVQELNEKTQHAVQAKQNAETLEKKLNLNSKEIAAFEITREWILLKEARKASFFACYAAFDKLAKRTAQLLKVTKIQVKYLTKEEFQTALFEGKIPKDINLRKKHSIYSYENGKDVVRTGAEATIFIAQNVSEKYSQEKIKVIKGQTAYPGIVTGKVKIIREPADMQKMQDGDVLVSPATNPNILPAMKKAAAFVTDVGGITCHAAIVAREMKKPCVIGTKIATRVLNDGDLVEVNGETGEVRKIS